MATVIYEYARRLARLCRRLRPRRSIRQAGLVILLFGVIGFSVYQVARHLTVGLSTLRTQEIVDQSYVQLDLYLFRDEAVMVSPGSNVCLYTAQNGEKVRVGSSMGTAYAAEDAEYARLLQILLNTYAERIALLEAEGGQGTPDDVRDAVAIVDDGYLGILEAVERGDLSAAGGYADRMLRALGRYEVLTGSAEGVSASALRAEQAALVAELTAVGHLQTDRGGYFYYDVDGYESVFPYAAAMTMTAEEFLAMTECGAAPTTGGAVGKMVYSPEWYAAAYVSLNDAAHFAVGGRYAMLCGESGDLEIDMTVARMVPDANGALLVFKTQAMPEGFSFDRRITVETVTHSIGGYRIPAEAIVTLPSPVGGEPVRGVYILSGNVVEFRKIRIKVRHEGYVIAETYGDIKAMLEGLDEGERDKLTADGWSFLNINDKIITSGTELHEGKVIS